MIRAHLWREKVNEYWRIKSQTDDEFYFGLGDRIQARQDAKIPVAGAGTVEFLDKSSGLFKRLGVFFPAARKIATLIEIAEQEVRKKSGITT